jgi:hypothetical protein
MRYPPITPRCCMAARVTAMIRLKYAYRVWVAGVDDAGATFRTTPPEWRVSWQQSDGEVGSSVAVSHCPFCGVSLPAVQPRRRLPRQMRVNDGDDDCETCGRYLGHCRCAPPEYYWEPVR